MSGASRLQAASLVLINADGCGSTSWRAATSCQWRPKKKRIEAPHTHTLGWNSMHHHIRESWTKTSEEQLALTQSVLQARELKQDTRRCSFGLTNLVFSLHTEHSAQLTQAFTLFTLAFVRLNFASYFNSLLAKDCISQPQKKFCSKNFVRWIGFSCLAWNNRKHSNKLYKTAKLP